MRWPNSASETQQKSAKIRAYQRRIRARLHLHGAAKADRSDHFFNQTRILMGTGINVNLTQVLTIRFSTRMATIAVLCVTAALTCRTAFGSAVEGEAEFWIRQAESACNEIEDWNSADRAFFRLHAVYVQWGEIAKADKITARIRDNELRVKAHIANARHYAETGELDRCKLELNLARPLKVNSLVRDDLVDAYLRFADSPKLAISYITEHHDTPKAYEDLCEALGRHGHFDEAWKIAEQEQDAYQQTTLKLSAAFAAAKAARIVDTERAIEQLAGNDRAERSEQSIWCELAKALYRKGDMESARKYATRVTNKYTIRTNRDLRRIANDVPPDAPYVNKSASKTSTSSFPQLTDDENPEKADRVIEAMIARAEKNPVKASTGQFGPWNQAAQLAKIRLQYAQVSALYRKAGNQDEATKKLKLAEEAIQTLVQENSFAGMLLLYGIYNMQIEMDDTEGLKRCTAVVNPSLWLKMADPIVTKVLSSGDIDGAKEIAWRALGAKPAIVNSDFTQRSSIIARFIEAGETQAAHELVRTSEPVDITAAACEIAGRAMINSDRGQILRTSKWRNDIGAYQRAHLSIGAAIAAKQQNSQVN